MVVCPGSPMLLAPPGSSLLLPLAAVLFLALSHEARSCPLLQRRLCEAANATGPDVRQCGEHAVRCSGSTAQIQFYGEGEWCTIQEFSYEDRVLVVQDPGVLRKLSHYDCGLVYSFPAPAPALPRPMPFQNSLGSGFSLFNCEVGTYNFTKDAFAGAYNSPGCRGFDLYYAYEYDGQPLRDAPPDCADGGHLFEWRLRLDETGRNLSVLLAGFSHQRKLRPDCFGCRMSRGDCSPLAVGNASACSCDNTCPGVMATMIGFVSSSTFILYLFFRSKLHYLFRKWKSKNTQIVEDFLEQYGTLIPKRYSYIDVKKMAKSFSKPLGNGGYGKVFKGELPSGRLVAVKVLNESKGNGEEFLNEVASIGKTYHVNIVSLLGFCSNGSKRALIYEFMTNGSLEKVIFSKAPRDALAWNKLYNIAVGIARGLEYLHRGCNIVHFDIKPHNILLDQDFCPKISDFGLAKLCCPKESILSLADTRGTIGYIAPEVFSRNFGVISSKSDVYSYGMMVLEIVGGRKNVDSTMDNVSEVYFPHWVYEQLVKGYPLQISDITSEIEEVARKMIIVGLWCIQTSPNSRPLMSNVIEMLEGSVEDLKMPPKPYLSSPTTSCFHSSS